MAIYTSFLGDGSCEGKSGETEMALVTREAVDNPSYSVHTKGSDSSQFDGMKIRLTNMISAGGGLAPAWVQVTGLTEDEMPLSKTHSGIIIIKVRGLSADGSLNADSESYGYIVLI